jgi:hypothetical protein
VDLLALDANPFHKDIYVEVDWMEAADHTHRPIASGIAAFRMEPVANPDDSTGVWTLTNIQLSFFPNLLSNGPINRRLMVMVVEKNKVSHLDCLLTSLLLCTGAYILQYFYADAPWIRAKIQLNLGIFIILPDPEFNGEHCCELIITVFIIMLYTETIKVTAICPQFRRLSCIGNYTNLINCRSSRSLHPNKCL